MNRLSTVKPLKVTFDSNVWQPVILPDNYSSDPSYTAFKRINECIRQGMILGFLGESIFTLESIKKKERQNYFQNYTPSYFSQEKFHGAEMKISISIGPDNTSHPGSNSYVDEYLLEALKMDFKVLPNTRLAWIKNPDFDEKNLFEPQNIEDYAKRFGELIRDMEVHQCGSYLLQIIGKEHHEHWIEGLKVAPPSEENRIAKALAEFADGDSIAVHYANRNDYFCTRDEAGNAGQNSVFSEKNRNWLDTRYGLKFIRPDELNDII